MMPKRLLFLSLITFLLGCGNNSSDLTSSAYLAPTSFNEKEGEAYTEADLASDDSLMFSSKNNILTFLEDPDFDPGEVGGDLGAIPGSDRVPLHIGEEKPYTVCLVTRNDAEDSILMNLVNSVGATILSIEDDGCYEVTLQKGDFHIDLARVPDELGGEEMPFFFTFEGENVIAVKFNACPYCDLEGLNVEGKNLRRTDLFYTNLNNSNFNNSRLEFVEFTDSTTFGATWDGFTEIGCIDLITDIPPDSRNEKRGSGHRKGISMTAMYDDIQASMVAGVVVKHTYPMVDEGGVYHSWGALGRNTGGDGLAGTRTVCEEEACIDLETVAYIMTEEPCIWPKRRFYNVAGVCWNATNRGLYYTNKTVYRIPFYTAILALHGTYGIDDDSWCWTDVCDEARRRFSWDACLDAVEAIYPWQGGTFRSQSQMEQDHYQPNQKAMPATLNNPEIALYERYRSKNKINRLETGLADSTNEKGLEDERKELRLEYLQDLLKLNIERFLGGVSDDELGSLLMAHRIMYQSFSEINNNSDAGRLAQSNIIMNTMLQTFKSILGMDRYLQLMNLETDSAFDIESYQ